MTVLESEINYCFLMAELSVRSRYIITFRGAWKFDYVIVLLSSPMDRECVNVTGDMEDLEENNSPSTVQLVSVYCQVPV